MREIEFKTLMHCGQYVNANLLESGIYTCPSPFIYDKYETIETLISKAVKVQDIMGKHHISERYFDSLKQCQLVSITININP